MPTRYATWQKEKPRDGVDLVGMNESDSVCFCTPDFATFILDFRDRILSVPQSWYWYQNCFQCCCVTYSLSHLIFKQLIKHAM